LPLVFCPLKGDHQPMQLGIAHKFMAVPPRLVSEFIDHVAKRASQADLPGIMMHNQA